MRGYANQALALSTRNARNAASPSRLPRMAFRSALRVAEAIPSAKRRMFGATPARGPLVQETRCWRNQSRAGWLEASKPLT